MTAELVETRPNESSGQCPSYSSLAEKLAKRETMLAKFEAELDQAAAKLAACETERDEAVVKLAENDAENFSLERRVDELNRGASVNSFNSGKPSSSDGPAKPPADRVRTRNLHRKTNRKSGGQPGHRGSKPIRVDDPDEVVGIFPRPAPAEKA